MGTWRLCALVIRTGHAVLAAIVGVTLGLGGGHRLHSRSTRTGSSRRDHPFIQALKAVPRYSANTNLIVVGSFRTTARSSRRPSLRRSPRSTDRIRKIRAPTSAVLDRVSRAEVDGDQGERPTGRKYAREETRRGGRSGRRAAVRQRAFRKDAAVGDDRLRRRHPVTHTGELRAETSPAMRAIAPPTRSPRRVKGPGDGGTFDYHLSGTAVFMSQLRRTQ